MMKKHENPLARKPLNSNYIDDMVSYNIKKEFLNSSFDKVKAALMWYADTRNKGNENKKDSYEAKLVKELDYFDKKEAFYREAGLNFGAECRVVLEEMCRKVDMPNPEIYYGIDHGASFFSKIRSGRIKPTRKLLTAFSVNMGLDECYARMLFEANGMKMSETDRKSYLEGIKDSRDLGYLMVYDKKENSKAAAR